MSRYLPVTFAGSVGATAIRHGRLPKAMAKLRRRAQFLKRELNACRARLNLPPEEPGEEDFDDEAPMQGAPGWMETAFGGRIPAGPVEAAWAPETRLSPNVRVRTRRGVRVVWRRLADGLWMLIEVPEATLQRATAFGGEEVGFVDLIVKAATGTAAAIQQGVKAGQRGGKPGDIAKAMGQGFMNTALPGVLPGSRPAPQAAPAPAPAAAAPCQCRSAVPQLPGPVAPQPSIAGWPTMGCDRCACAQCGRA